MIQRTLPFATALVLLAGCGGGDDDKASGPATTTDHAMETSEAMFKDPDVGFTFHYPTDLEYVAEPKDRDTLAVITPDPEDDQNGVKVRKVAEQELAFNEYAATVKAQFADELKTEVTQSTDAQNGVDLGVLSWSTKGLESANYFFAMAGKTWQIECLSTTEHRDAIDAACGEIVGSLSE